ncbi:domain XH [Artemisia annua]|uniref:Domain XH n=1 Tax=Artemisia annua TaxID=35608 RepID=A0A2U1P987_ARTAN|nr:domain XH [Artemisia annua]
MTEDFMEQSYSDESDANGSEIEEYEEKSYEELKGGKHAIKLPDEAFTCPYCPNKKRHGYPYIDLLQHATMIGKSDSKKRSKKDKANHLALAKYLEKDISEASGPTQPIDAVDHLEDHDGDEMFVWPWKGVVVNLPIELIDGRYIGKSGSSMRDELTKRGFNPMRVHPLWNFCGHSGSAVVEFRKDMVGFYNAMSFEKAYEADHHGKKDWDSDNESKSGIYGWVARAEDYRSNTIIGEHLRKIADIRTVSDIKKEEDHKTIQLLSNLENVRESKRRRVEEITMKCMETDNTLSKLIAEKDKNDQAFNEEIKKIHLRAQEHIQKIFNDHDKTKMKIENERRVLELQTIELQNREVVNENERKKLAQEIEENAVRTSSLRVASDDQKKADESVMKLADYHKREKEKLDEKIIFLEKQLDAKHALELEIKGLEAKLQVKKHMGDDDPLLKEIEDLYSNINEKKEELEYVESIYQTLFVQERKANDELQEARKELIEREKEKLDEKIIFLEKQLDAKHALELEIKGLEAKLQVKKHMGDDDPLLKEIEDLYSNINEKKEELEYVESIYQTLFVQERKANDELQEARKELIEGFKELSKAKHIGVKRMGELENKPFYDAMKQMYNETEAEDKASELCSLWEEYLRDPNWHPFKVITINGKSEKIIDESDEKLKSLKRDLGEKVYEAVTTALTEINDYNPSGGYVTTELWNFTEGKKATLKDGVSCLLKMWDTQKRKRIT